MPLIAALASLSNHIGLAAAIAWLTAGRSAWIATMGTGRPSDFGHVPARDLAVGRARAAESSAVVRKLWDSWEVTDARWSTF